MKRHRWTTEEDSTLESRWGTDSPATLASMFGVSEKSLRCRVNHLGLSLSGEIMTGEPETIDTSGIVSSALEARPALERVWGGGDMIDFPIAQHRAPERQR